MDGKEDGQDSQREYPEEVNFVELTDVAVQNDTSTDAGDFVGGASNGETDVNVEINSDDIHAGNIATGNSDDDAGISSVVNNNDVMITAMNTPSTAIDATLTPVNTPSAAVDTGTLNDVSEFELSLINSQGPVERRTVGINDTMAIQDDWNRYIEIRFGVNFENGGVSNITDGVNDELQRENTIGTRLLLHYMRMRGHDLNVVEGVVGNRFAYQASLLLLLFASPPETNNEVIEDTHEHVDLQIVNEDTNRDQHSQEQRGGRTATLGESVPRRELDIIRRGLVNNFLITVHSNNETHENMGLRQKEIAKIKRITIDLPSSPASCCICLEDFTEGRQLRCKHRHHVPCIDKWLESSNTCPLCRVPAIKKTDTNSSTPSIYYFMFLCGLCFSLWLGCHLFL